MALLECNALFASRMISLQHDACTELAVGLSSREITLNLLALHICERGVNYVGQLLDW